MCECFFLHDDKFVKKIAINRSFSFSFLFASCLNFCIFCDKFCCFFSCESYQKTFTNVEYPCIPLKNRRELVKGKIIQSSYIVDLNLMILLWRGSAMMMLSLRWSLTKALDLDDPFWLTLSRVYLYLGGIMIIGLPPGNIIWAIWPIWLIWAPIGICRPPGTWPRKPKAEELNWKREKRRWKIRNVRYFQ